MREWQANLLIAGISVTLVTISTYVFIYALYHLNVLPFYQKFFMVVSAVMGWSSGAYIAYIKNNG